MVHEFAVRNKTLHFSLAPPSTAIYLANYINPQEYGQREQEENAGPGRRFP